MGDDPNLSLNLESFFTMSYCNPYELLFCIEDKSDPAIKIVEQLCEKYPQIDAQIFLGGSVVGVNPKINNMSPAYNNAKYEYIMISDSNIKSKYSSLLLLIYKISPRLT